MILSPEDEEELYRDVVYPCYLPKRRNERYIEHWNYYPRLFEKTWKAHKYFHLDFLFRDEQRLIDDYLKYIYDTRGVDEEFWDAVESYNSAMYHLAPDDVKEKMGPYMLVPHFWNFDRKHVLRNIDDVKMLN